MVHHYFDPEPRDPDDIRELNRMYSDNRKLRDELAEVKLENTRLIALVATLQASEIQPYNVE